MIDANRSDHLTSHVDFDLYGDPDFEAAKIREKQRQDFNEMVHAALNGSKSQGKSLIEYLESYLKAPIWFPEENTNLMPYREGARSFVQHLLNAYNAGGVPLDPKK